uniref:GTP-binding protein Rhes n=1 Tax=Caligus rogercresseyi TaxID=217165 RepID=C1BR73_CALRO|nr:GTP-binding protein Rhes precursor [Caligus rogercresseyi]
MNNSSPNSSRSKNTFHNGINTLIREKYSTFRQKSGGSLTDKESFESDTFPVFGCGAPSSTQSGSRSRISSLKSYDSTDSSNSSVVSCGGSLIFKSNYRILMMGPVGVGKSSIIHQFLYDTFSEEHSSTMDDMFHGEFDWLGRTISFDIHDTSGNYAYEFPAMFNICLNKADAFIIVFSLEDPSSWDEASRLRDLILEVKGPESVPIVVVGNKSDLETSKDIVNECVEATVTFDWENGYVEAPAKEGRNINKIFKEMLTQAKCRFDLSSRAEDMVSSNGGIQKKKHSLPDSESLNSWKRRQSLPAAPLSSRKTVSPQLRIQLSLDQRKAPEEGVKPTRRRSSLAVLRRDSCNIA